MGLHFLLIYMWMATSSHSIHIALIKICEIKDHYKIEITLDIKDLEITLKTNKSDITVMMMDHYINENMSIKFDQIPADIIIKQIAINNDHFKISGELMHDVYLAKTFTVTNSILTNIDNHSNIVQLRINNIEDDYHMNRKRTHLSINL